MIQRYLLPELRKGIAEVPAVCLLGPRQVGKTTLALALAGEREAVYLDLESESDLARLEDPESYLSLHVDKLVVLDELHRLPAIFPSLRGMIDRGRREGKRSGMYLLLGSAALGLLKQSGETLAGRVRYLELTPFFVLEETGRSLQDLWLRGGYPESLLAPSDERSFRWREDFVRTYLERDIAEFGPRIPSETLRRLWVMLAHRQGAPLNASELARSSGIDVRTVNRYVDLLEDLFLVRRLLPWHANVGKRLVKSPRMYLRDSGMVHQLLQIRTYEELLAHPVAGASWEGLVIENLSASAPEGTSMHFYRTAGGAEIDLLIVLPNQERWAVEIKRSLAPRLGQGFYRASQDVFPHRRFLVYPGVERYPLGDGCEAIPLAELAEELSHA